MILEHREWASVSVYHHPDQAISDILRRGIIIPKNPGKQHHNLINAVLGQRKKSQTQITRIGRGKADLLSYTMRTHRHPNQLKIKNKITTWFILLLVCLYNWVWFLGGSGWFWAIFIYFFLQGDIISNWLGCLWYNQSPFDIFVSSFIEVLCRCLY